MKFILLSLLFVTPLLFASAAEECNDVTPDALEPMLKVAEAVNNDTECSNPKKLRGMCAVVGDLTEDSEPQGKYKYLYQRKIFEAACVDINKDSEEEIARKVSKVWKENEDKLICNNTRFEVANGNIIKFAVDSTFDSFLTDIATWKINLNKVDETDGRTVLDYVKYQMERAKGTPSEQRISFYYRTLRSAGAKHKSEL